MNARKADVVPLDTTIPGFQKAKTIGDRIRVIREWRGVTQKTLSENVAGREEGKRARSSVSQWERNFSLPSYDKLADVAHFLDVTPEFLAYGVTTAPKEVAPDPDKLGYALVPEGVFESQTNRRNVATWGIPAPFLRSELGCDKFAELMIHKIEGTCEPYERGDRVLVDLSQTKPSPPGFFLLWDGLAATLAHVSVTPSANGKLQARVKSDVGTYEAPIDKIHILGRIKGTWKKA